MNVAFTAIYNIAKIVKYLHQYLIATPQANGLSLIAVKFKDCLELLVIDLLDVLDGVEGVLRVLHAAVGVESDSVQC